MAARQPAPVIGRKGYGLRNLPDAHAPARRLPDARFIEGRLLPELRAGPDRLHPEIRHFPPGPDAASERTKNSEL